MEKENQIYRRLHKTYTGVVSEHWFKTEHNITDIDVGILQNNFTCYIQIKNGEYVNSKKKILKFSAACSQINKTAVKIWYSEFTLSESLLQLLKQENIKFACSIHDIDEFCKNAQQKLEQKIKLRSYQKNAVAEVCKKYDESGIIMFPPGCGKTITAIEICNKLRKYYKKILWITRRKEILANEFNDTTGYKNLEIYNHLTVNGKHNSLDKPGLHIMNTDRFLAWNTINADYIVVDECHNSGAPKTYKKLKQFTCPKLGLSATPYTGNHEHEMRVRRLFPEVFSALDPFTAIDKCYSLPLEFWFESDTYAAIDDVRKQLPWFKCIAWCDTIDHCNEYYHCLCERFPDLLIYRSHTKIDPKNSQILQFKNETTNCILVCVNRAREGWNDPRINCVIFMDAVKNRAFNVSIQTGNRANRNYTDENGVKKTRAVVIDCVNRDPLDILLQYYFAYNPKQMFTKIVEHLSVKNNALYYKNVIILNNVEDFSQRFTIKNFQMELQEKIYGKTEYKKFILDFQDYLYHENSPPDWRKMPACYDSYLTIVSDNYEFIHNPVLQFPFLKWHDVFGKKQKVILNWTDFRKFCREQYIKYKPRNLKQFYQELAKNNELPDTPTIYAEYTNLANLFGKKSVIRHR